jgi:hypothetical protein
VDEDPCSLCGRTPKRVVQEMSLEARRGQERFCQVNGCPLMQRWRGFVGEENLEGDSAYGPSPPSLFVGRHGYPNVNLGPLMTPGEVDQPGLMDEPSSWTGMQLGDVLAMRSGLIRGNATVEVSDARRIRDPTRATEVTQELAMAAKPAYTELSFSREVDLDLTPQLGGFTAPTGPTVTLEKAQLAENPSVPRQVDQIVYDTDAKATTGAWELYDKGIPDYQVQRLLAAGLLGRANDRRFVPTRWSITATDDMLGKRLIRQAQDRQQLGQPQLFFHELYGNRFHVLLIPGPWAFEMLEAWLVPEPTPEGQSPERSVKLLQDGEGHEPRTSYADDITGAYYAARLSVLEHLVSIGRQARALVLREITDDYYAPAGVWVIREAVRNAMAEGPRYPDTVEHGLQRIREENVIGPDWAGNSRLIDEHRHQAQLTAFLD